MSALVAELGVSLRPYLERQYAFFGHSMGALIAFELSRFVVREYDAPPLHLFVSGCRAPQLPERMTWGHPVTDMDLVNMIRNLNGTPHSVFEHDELLDLTLRTLRADIAMCASYSYIAAFGGLDDSQVTQEELALWREQTSSTFSVHMLPGEHFFIQSSHASLLSLIYRHLDEKSA